MCVCVSKIVTPRDIDISGKRALPLFPLDAEFGKIVLYANIWSRTNARGECVRTEVLTIANSYPLRDHFRHAVAAVTSFPR